MESRPLKTCAAPLDNPRQPMVPLPAGSCDAHCHIFGPFDRYPLPDDRSFNPAPAPETALRKLHARLGLERAVIVQSQGHGFDHRPLLDALEAGAGRYKGVGLVRATDSDALIARFDAAGIRGARFHFLPHLGGRPDLDAIRSVVGRIAVHGWHLAIHVAGDDILEFEPFIRDMARQVRIAIDHVARVDIRAGSNGPAVGALRRLMDTGQVWVKLSGADRLSDEGTPFGDTRAILRMLIEHGPERVLWGTDWPHVNLSGPMPDDADLVDLILEVVPEERLRQQLLVDNPAAFFGFDA